MALPPPSDTVLVREVDEELRLEAMLRFWREWGRWVLIGVAVLLVVLGGLYWWHEHNDAVSGAEGEKLNTAFQDYQTGKVKDARDSFAALTASNSPGYRSTARLAQADLLIEKNDVKGAVAKFAEVVADPAAPQPMRDAALIRQTIAEFDTIKPEVVIQRLGPLAVKGTPWFGTTGELVAIANLRLGKRDVAVRTLRDMGGDATLTDSIRTRAVHLADALSAASAKPAEEKKAQ